MAVRVTTYMSNDTMPAQIGLHQYDELQFQPGQSSNAHNTTCCRASVNAERSIPHQPTQHDHSHTNPSNAIESRRSDREAHDGSHYNAASQHPHTHQAHAAFCFSHTNSVCSRDRQTEHRSNEHHDEGTGHGGSHANNHSVRIILILLEQEANKRGETQRKHKQCATIHTIMISIMPLRKVPATCAPNNEAPRNSKMAAMMMACRTLTARDPTEVPNCTPPHTIIAKNH
jgi:hypothetical protein